MERGLLQIELQTRVNNDELSIGSYLSPIVPCVGETLLFQLHPGHYAIPGEQEKTHPGLFKVINITYVAFNQEKTEQWFDPWSADKISDYILVDVRAIDDAAEQYLRRLMIQE